MPCQRAQFVNSRRLKSGRSQAARAVLMQRAAEIKWSDFDGVMRLGITAGASARKCWSRKMGAFAERYALDIETVTATEGVLPAAPPAAEHEAAN
jgi:4-hydroxy-3-methylbut-2-enyl diphosphate reductase